MASEFEMLVVKMAKAYLATKKATMDTVAEKFNVSSSTVGKYLNKILPAIDPDLWDKVQKKKEANIARSRQNFAPKKAPAKKTTSEQKPVTKAATTKTVAKRTTSKRKLNLKQ